MSMRLFAVWSLIILLSPSTITFDYSSSSTSSILHVYGQIVHAPLVSELDRARMDAIREGKLNELRQLSRRKERRRGNNTPANVGEASGPIEENDEVILPAPQHIVLTPSGKQDFYQPDREKHIRLPRHHHRRPPPAHVKSPIGGHSQSGYGLPDHIHEGSIKVPTPRKGHGRSLLRPDGTQIGPRRKNPNSNQATTKPVPIPIPGATATASAPTNDYSSNAPENLPADEEGRVFKINLLNEEQLAALAAMDAGDKPPTSSNEGGGFLATLADNIIDPHSNIARPSKDSARGAMLIVLVPLGLLFFGFLAWSVYIYQKRTALEEKQRTHAHASINAQRKRGKAHTASTSTTTASSSASTSTIASGSTHGSSTAHPEPDGPISRPGPKSSSTSSSSSSKRRTDGSSEWAGVEDDGL